MTWQELDAKISELEAEAFPGSFRHLITLSGPNWSKVRELIAEIHQDFKGARYPTREEHQRAWERFSAAKAEAYRRRNDEREVFRQRSAEHRSSILLHLRPARLGTFSAYDVAAMKELSRLVTEASRMLSEHKDEMLAEHKRECGEAIREIREQHNAWWEEHRQASAERHRAWRAGVEANIAKNREKLARALDALHRYQERVAELEAKIASAWNHEWAAAASSRLAEIEAKVEDIRDSIRRLERWIDEDEEKLRAD